MCHPREMSSTISASTNQCKPSFSDLDGTARASSPVLSTMEEYFSNQQTHDVIIETLEIQESPPANRALETEQGSRQQACLSGPHRRRRGSHVANRSQLRMVEGRLQAVGFVGDLAESGGKQTLSPQQRRATRRRESFAEQVIFFLMK